MEASYHFHKDYPSESLVAHVSSNREALALAYFDWAAKDQTFQMDTLEERVISFEEDRFGRALEPVAHAMLMFAVKSRASHHKRPPDCLFASEEERETLEKVALALEPIPDEGMEARLTRIAVASGIMAPPKVKGKPLAEILRPMPDAPVEDPAPVVPPLEEIPLILGNHYDNLPAIKEREPGEDDDEDTSVEWLEEQ